MANLLDNSKYSSYEFKQISKLPAPDTIPPRRGTKQLIQLNNPTTGASDYFGMTVDIYGRLVAIAAPYDDTNGSSSGQIHFYDVYDLSYRGFMSGVAGQYVGDVFRMTGNKLISASSVSEIGHYRNDIHQFLTTAGYTPTPSSLPNPNAETSSTADDFGYSVSLCDGQAVIGARFEEYLDTTVSPSVLYTNTGVAYIYSWSSTTTPTLRHTVYPVNPKTTNRYFGSSVDCRPGLVAIGDYGKDGNGGTWGNSGGCDIYIRYATSLYPAYGNAELEHNTPVGLNMTAGVPTGDQAFQSLILVGDKVYGSVIGDGNWTDKLARATIIEYDIPSKTFRNYYRIEPEGNPTGTGTYTLYLYKFHVDGGLVSASHRTLTATSTSINTEAVTIFDRATYSQIYIIYNPNPNTTSVYDQFGSTTQTIRRANALSGNHLVIGAYAEDVNAGNSGVAYIYNIEDQMACAARAFQFELFETQLLATVN